MRRPGRAADGPRDQADAYVRLRVLPADMVGRLRWWTVLARELRATIADRAASPGLIGALAAARAGFYPSSHAIYELDGPGRRDYVSDRERELTWSLDWPAAGLLDDKLAFFFMLRHLGVPTPEVSGVIVRGNAHPLNPHASPGSGAGWLRERLEARGKLIVRPTRGGGGRGLWALQSHTAGFMLNGQSVSWSDIENRLHRLADHVVTDFVTQAAYARDIFAGTTNTVRALTMHGETTGPVLSNAVHRIGTRASMPADNWSRGGLSVDLDVATGKLGRAVMKPGDDGLQWFDRHPDTGAPITGIEIPGWSRAREGLLALAARVPFLPYVGWDLVITDDGFSVIEGNKYSDVNLLQVHRPIKRDPRARAFYAEHQLDG